MTKKKTPILPKVGIGQLWRLEYGKNWGKAEEDRVITVLILGLGQANDIIKSWRVWNFKENCQMNAADEWFKTPDASKFLADCDARGTV